MTRCVTGCTALLVALAASSAQGAFTLVDFSVDPAHVNPFNQHEVFYPDFDNFELCITGTFDPTRCYEVQIHRTGGAPCGSANSSGTDQAQPGVPNPSYPILCGVNEVTATSLRVDISPNAMASFKRGDDWEIEVKERDPGCSGSSTAKIHPILLKIAGCNDTCLLNGTTLTATPNPTACDGITQLCAVAGGSGNLMYEWDTDGDGFFDDATTFAPENCIDTAITSTTTVAVFVTDFGTNVACTSTASELVTVSPNNCSDGNPCTDDVCETGVGCVYTPDDSNSCSDGLYCNGQESCSAGACQPGTPPDCNDGIACTADSCDEANDVCDHDPVPGFCDNGLYCDGVEVCHPTLGCQDGADPCAPPTYCDEAGDTCVECLTHGHCSDGMYCNGAELCIQNVCEPGTPPNCNDGIACTVDSCDNGLAACVNDPDDDLCDDGEICTDDVCIAGVGCDFPNNASLCDDGDPCTLNDVCVNGVCMGTPKDCTSLDTACSIGVCNAGTGVCESQAANNGDPCNDGLFCTTGEVCAGGVCGGGTPLDCGDGVACTVDVCDEANDVCQHTPSNGLCNNNIFCDGSETCHVTLGCQPGTNPCGDGIACTTDACDEDDDACVYTPDDNLCQNGQFCDGTEVCNANLGCQPGTPVNCDDGVACTVDNCNETTDVCDHLPDNVSCQNGLFCDGNEVCDPILGCVDGGDPCAPPLFCDEPNDDCVQCLNNGHCDDGLFCNGSETCVNGTCQPGTPPDCDDGIACTVDSCNEAADSCNHVPNNASCQDGLFCNGQEVCDVMTGCGDGPDPCSPPLLCDEANDSCVQCLTNADCSDGQFCNGSELCIAGTCQPGTPPNCDDGVACTTDSCNEGTDVCDHTPQHGTCQDGLFCNGAEVCDPILGCIDAADPCAPPSLCDESTDSCVECLTNADCDDGLYCDGAEVCVAGVCQPGTPPDCDDAIACTTDACNEATDSCDHTPDNGACQNGLFCDGMEICDLFVGCVDGADPCAPPSLCDEATDSCVECLSAADCNDGQFCNGVELCVAGVCQPGTPPNCDDGVACTTDTCNEATDSCDHTPVNTACQDGDFCNGMEICDVTNGCVDGPDPCGPPTFCDEGTDTCVNCLTNADCNDNLFCNGTETCVSGDCQPGTPPNCSDGIACTIDSCNEATDSCDHTPDSGACQDGLFCNGMEVCDVTLGCVDATDPCAPPSLCDEATDQCVECLTNADCDDSLHCNGVETCLAGVCQPGTPPNCDDGVACTVDSCDEISDACDHAPNPTLCQNGLFCDGMEVCDPINGCEDGPDPCGPPSVCDESTDSCVECLTNAHCDDGLFCNGSETCVNNLCTPGTPPDCDDGVACTVDSCNEMSDGCDHVPDNGVCQDGLFCNGMEVCDVMQGCLDGPDPCAPPSVCDEATDACVECLTNAQCDDGAHCNGSEQCINNNCEPGTPPNCDDGVACTIDSCDEANDACEHVPDAGSCQDGLFCNGMEVCDLTLGCVDAVDPCAPPSKCDEATDACVECLTDNQCDNGLFCDGAEVCIGGSCAAGTPPNCNDNVSCTIDSCDEIGDVCAHTPSNALCNDGLFCNGSETCDPLNGCQAGISPCPADSVSCTIDTCDEGTNTCLHTPSDGLCDNGVFCDGEEFCDAVLDCQPGSDPCPSDNIPCTSDSCDEQSNACVYAPNNMACDNGVFCDGAEVCNVMLGCIPGPGPCAPDAFGCTTDICNEIKDMCQYIPDDSFCDDGQFCNGAESCDPMQGCVAGADPCPVDAVGCTEDSCDEMLDTCLHTPNDALCTDGLFCNGEETCDLLNDCEAGPAPCPPDAIDCTVDSCDEGTDTCLHVPDDAICEDGLVCTQNQCTDLGCITTGENMCGACCINGVCDDTQSEQSCLQLGGYFPGPGIPCGQDSDGDGIDDPCDTCPGVDDAVFGPCPLGQIPTVSEWGMAILALLLLTASKLAFGYRRAWAG